MACNRFEDTPILYQIYGKQFTRVLFSIFYFSFNKILMRANLFGKAKVNKTVKAHNLKFAFLPKAVSTAIRSLSTQLKNFDLLCLPARTRSVTFYTCCFFFFFTRSQSYRTRLGNMKEFWNTKLTRKLICTDF